MAQTRPDISEFTRLFNKNRQRLVMFAVSYVGDKAIAEDIVMDAFLYYWEKLPTLDNQSNPRSYLLKTVKNKCLNILRSKAATVKVKENIWNHSHRILQLRISTLEALDPEEIYSREAQEAVKKAIESLPLRTKEIFILSRIEEKSHREIAEQMSITVKSVEFEITKANKLLRASLGNSSLYYSMLTMLILNLIKS